MGKYLTNSFRLELEAIKRTGYEYDVRESVTFTRIFYFFKFNLVTAGWVAYLNQILADDSSKISHRRQVDISKFRRGIPNN